MLEVEKKFQPTKEQLGALLKEAEHIGHETNHDIYYDYSDFRLLKQGVRVRKRNDSFELKARVSKNTDQEIENLDEINKFFKEVLRIEKDFYFLISDDLQIIAEYINERERYQKDGFNIDVDHLSFGYDLCEIEKKIDDPALAKETRKKIKEFAKSFGIENTKPLSKMAEFLKRFNEEKFKEIYPQAENQKEKKNIFNIFKMK